MWTLVALATVPLAARVARALDRFYDSPYELMPYLGTNVQLHLYTGLLLLAGYIVAIVVGHVAPHASIWMR